MRLPLSQLERDGVDRHDGGWGPQVAHAAAVDLDQRPTAVPQEFAADSASTGAVMWTMRTVPATGGDRSTAGPASGGTARDTGASAAKRNRSRARCQTSVTASRQATTGSTAANTRLGRP